MKAKAFPAQHNPNDLAESIDEAISSRVHGTVNAIVGHRIEVQGLNAPVGAVCKVFTSTGHEGAAKVIGFQGDTPILAALDELIGIASGDRVQLISKHATVQVGEGLIGRVIDALGRPMDGAPLPTSLRTVPVEQESPMSLDRPPIDKTYETGIRVVDSLLTCGQGQRIGIFAGSGVGKSTLMGMLARSTQADVIVIGLVGERGREVREFIEHTLGESGMKRSTLVVATNDQPATMRIQAAWTATAVATALRESGKNVVLLMDSVTRFAMAQRELGLAAGEPPTTRGYPPSVFAQLPKLVEQSGRTNAGTITAFYAVLVEGDDTNEPISDTLRGLLDGHIVLSRDLASEGHWPAIDALQSLSRLQNSLLPKEILQAASSIRRHLTNYASNADLINIGAYRAGGSPELDRAIEMRPLLREFLTQASDDYTTLANTLKRTLELGASA